MNQKTIPDYSLYHLHELESALKNIDLNASPEEATIIREFIQKGGYKYQPTSVFTVEKKLGPHENDSRDYSDVVSLAMVKQVAFVSTPYKVILLFILVSFLLINITTWLSSRSGFVLIPIVFQGCLLAMVFLKHRFTRVLIKIWSSLLAVSGVAGILSMFFMGSYQTGPLIWHVASLSVGFSFLLLANQSVLLIPYAPFLPSSQDGSSSIQNSKTQDI